MLTVDRYIIIDVWSGGGAEFDGGMHGEVGGRTIGPAGEGARCSRAVAGRRWRSREKGKRKLWVLVMASTYQYLSEVTTRWGRPPLEVVRKTVNPLQLQTSRETFLC
jgi:hypothetical protein